MEEDTQKLLDKAVSTHGHLGPFLVMGLRMGLLAKKAFGEVPFRCEVETVFKKPYICAIDGIKAVMGNNGIDVKKGKGLNAKFSAVDGQEVSIKVRDSVLEKNAKVTWDTCEKFALDLMRSEGVEIFCWFETSRQEK